jgi:hypothetical protein
MEGFGLTGLKTKRGMVAICAERAKGDYEDSRGETDGGAERELL